MEKTYIDEVLGAVILRESCRAKTLSIKINRATGAVTVVFPVGYNQRRALAFLEEKRQQIADIIRRQKSSVSAPKRSASEYDLEELRARAKEYLPTRIAELAEQTNLSYNRVSIRVTRSRWGSCSSENNISLSVYLMILPLHLIDFVILHELCHTVHHNHSIKFHALLNHIIGGREKIYNKELRDYSLR